MPYPSAPNAYPAARNTYPSGPSGPPTLTDVPAGHRGGHPDEHVPIGVTVTDGTAPGSRTGESGAVTIVQIDVGDGSRTGATTDTLLVERLLVDSATAGSRTGETLDAQARVVDDPSSESSLTGLAAELPLDNAVTVTDPTSGTVGRTGHLAATAASGTLVLDDTTGSGTGSVDGDIDIVFGVTDVATGSGAGSPTSALLFSVTLPDDTANFSTGLTTSEMVSLGGPTVNVGDVADTARTGAGASERAGWPGTPGPPTTTIWTYNFPSATLFGPFYGGLTVPFGRIAPVTIQPPPRTPTYRLYVVNTVTGRLTYEVPFEKHQWGSLLNGLGSLSAELRLEHVYDALSDADERDPRTLFGQFLSGAYDYSLILTYGNAVVWGGLYTPSSIPSDSPTVRIGASEFGSILTRRLLLVPGTQPPGQEGDVILGPNSKPELARQIVAAATLGSYRSLPWTCFNPPPDAGDDIRTYYSYDTWTAWDALTRLSSEIDGPDFRFDPYLYEGSDGWYAVWDLVLGQPRLATPHEWGWDVPTTATLAWDRNVQNMATTYLGLGSGQDRQKMITMSRDETLLRYGFPAMELVDSLHTSTIDQYQLQALTDADLNAYRDPTVHWTVTAQASGDPLLGSYRCGDTFQVAVQDHPVIADGEYTRRITSLAGDQSDRVTIGSADSYVVTATTSTGVQLTTS